MKHRLRLRNNLGLLLDLDLNRLLLYRLQDSLLWCCREVLLTLRLHLHILYLILLIQGNLLSFILYGLLLAIIDLNLRPLYFTYEWRVRDTDGLRLHWHSAWHLLLSSLVVYLWYCDRMSLQRLLDRDNRLSLILVKCWSLWNSLPLMIWDILEWNHRATRLFGLGLRLSHAWNCQCHSLGKILTA